VSSIESFRQDVRDFVKNKLPRDIAAKVAMGRELEKNDYVRWQKLLAERGWLIGDWPKDWGGEGWEPERQLAFLQETGRGGAPMVIPYGVKMVGPVIQTFGTQAQKRRHLPGILSSDVWWCQGYSEPGAGSDLASLKTSAVREGGHYRVNGSKLWTTQAHWADWMHCLVRTDSGGKRQEGISFLLIDMKTPGLTIRPILTIDGQHHTNETFFDNVMVPAENLVGAEGRGWDIAKFLLGNERISIAETGAKLRLLETLKRMNARVQASENEPGFVKARLDAKLLDVEMQLATLTALETYLVRAWAEGRPVGSDGSILKVRGTEILQAMTEVALDLAGPYAAVHDPADLHEGIQVPPTAAKQASAMAHEYLYGRCWSIFGGANEIQRNIIAKTVLG
jgi:alkylation response protein AidB-like acyl-CoA dehydrogenase